MTIAEEQLDRLILLVQKSINENQGLAEGKANNIAATGIFITQPWELTWAEKKA